MSTVYQIRARLYRLPDGCRQTWGKLRSTDASGSQAQRFHRRFHPVPRMTPVDTGVVYEELDFVAIRITQVQALAHGMVGHPIDVVAVCLDTFMGPAQVIEALADLPADVVKTDAFSLQRARRRADLDQ